MGSSHHFYIMIEEDVVKQIHINIAKQTKKAKLKYPPFSLMYYLNIL